MESIKKKCNPNYKIGEVINLNDSSSHAGEINPDFYVIVHKIDSTHYGLVPAWKTKIPYSLLIWALPSNIYIKSELYFEKEIEIFRKNELFIIKKPNDAIQRIIKQKKKLEQRQKQKIHDQRRRNNQQIAKMSKKLDIQSRTDFNHISNLKSCQGGRVSPK